MREVYAVFPHLGAVLPSLGYSLQQREALRQTILDTPCDAVLLGTPADLGALLDIRQPVARVRFEVRDASRPALRDLVWSKLQKTRRISR